MLCVYLNHAPSLPCEQMALSVYITTSRSHRLSVMYLVCFMRTTWLTSDANHFVNAKSHAEDRNSARTVPHPFLSDIIDPRFGFFMFWKGSLSKIRWHLPRRVLPMVDYKGYLFSLPVRESKTFLDSGSHAMDCGFQVLDSFLVSGTWFLNSNR